MKKVFIAGCGYIGGRIARLAHEEGLAVNCMVRSTDHAERLKALGFSTVSCALDNLAEVQALDVAGAVLFYLVPPPGGGISDPRAANFCSALTGSAPPEKIVYISATSVYGQSRSLVNEDSPAVPDTAMGKRRLDAERVFLEFGKSRNVPVVILRVSGIYGPGRLPLMQIRQHQPLLLEEQSGPSNRIHADDLVQVCMAAAEKGEDGDIFNVSDGHPSSMTTYFNAVADLLGEERQPQVTLSEARQVMSPLMFSYVSETRIVDNTRMLEKLNIQLRYPTLKDGLHTCLV
ncbi:MAG TPA: SDR family oxidoreductase [Desulfuromonadaceae bacterium]|jgi:nucleoside-diphosphate-sugar epimerase